MEKDAVWTRVSQFAVVRYVLVPFFNILVGTKTRDDGGTLRRYNANRHSDSRLIDRLPGVLGT